MYWSIAAALLTLGLKTAAWLLTGSVGLLSDALESGINLLAALTAYFSLRYAARPVDSTHTYGHEKIEFFSSGLEGVLIALAALGIIRTAVLRLIESVPLESLGIGMAVAMMASAVNLVTAQYLLHVGRRYRSIVLEADGQHLMTDVWTSVAVLGGLGLVLLTGWQWIDPIFAFLMALHILWTAGTLIRRSFNGLMDHALSPEELQQLRGIISGLLEPETTFHAVRTRRAGNRRFADCHLLVPGDWSVARGHELVEKIERAVAQQMPGMELTLHLEPIDCARSYTDSALLKFEVADEGPAPSTQTINASADFSQKAAPNAEERT